MKNNFEKAYNKLVQKYNKKGRLTDDDFITITESLDISFIMLSELQDILYNEGIEITNTSSESEKASRKQNKGEQSYYKKVLVGKNGLLSIPKSKSVV